MAIKHGVDGAFGRRTKIARKAPDQQFADLARAPMGLVALEAHDQGFDLGRQLVGVTHWPAAAIGQRVEALIFVSIEDFVAGFAGDGKLPAQIGHRLAFDQAGHEQKTLFHSRTLFPWHPRLRPNGEKRYPCVRYETSPVSRVAQMRRTPGTAGTAPLRRICAVLRRRGESIRRTNERNAETGIA